MLPKETKPRTGYSKLLNLFVVWTTIQQMIKDDNHAAVVVITMVTK